MASSVFEPSSIKTLLANTWPSKATQKKFLEEWDNEVCSSLPALYLFTENFYDTIHWWEKNLPHFMSRWRRTLDGGPKHSGVTLDRGRSPPSSNSPHPCENSSSLLPTSLSMSSSLTNALIPWQSLATSHYRTTSHSWGLVSFPPTLHIVSKHCKIPLVLEAYYCHPVTIVHPIYYPVHCPNCWKASETPETLSDTANNQKISPEWWNTNGPHCVHGVDEEEFTLGLQLKCKACEAKWDLTRGAPGGHGPTKTNILFNLTSVDYWDHIPYWEIPGVLPTCYELIHCHGCWS